MDYFGLGKPCRQSDWQNAYNPHANYGNSNFDVRNAFKGNMSFISCPLGVAGSS